MRCSNWIQASVNCPQLVGWYQVSPVANEGLAVEKLAASQHFAYWDGEYWWHCYGWPAGQNVWQLVNDKVVIPVHGDGKPVSPGHGGMEPCHPVYWRGFLLDFGEGVATLRMPDADAALLEETKPEV